MRLIAGIIADPPYRLTTLIGAFSDIPRDGWFAAFHLQPLSQVPPSPHWLSSLDFLELSCAILCKRNKQPLQIFDGQHWTIHCELPIWSILLSKIGTTLRTQPCSTQATLRLMGCFDTMSPNITAHLMFIPLSSSSSPASLASAPIKVLPRGWPDCGVGSQGPLTGRHAHPLRCSTPQTLSRVASSRDPEQLITVARKSLVLGRQVQGQPPSGDRVRMRESFSACVCVV